MKPTDIWTNHPSPQFKQVCKNGAPCHVAAPRGSKTGVQGGVEWQNIGAQGMYSRAIMRGIMPDKLISHIIDITESELGGEV